MSTINDLQPVDSVMIFSGLHNKEKHIKNSEKIESILSEVRQKLHYDRKIAKLSQKDEDFELDSILQEHLELPGLADWEISAIHEDKNQNQSQESISRMKNQLLNEIIKSIETMNERILAGINDVKTSRIFEITGDPSENRNIMGNFTREFHADVLEETQRIREKYDEILSYPREIRHYAAKYHIGRRNLLDCLKTNTEKYDRILHWELTDRLAENLLNLRKMVYTLLNLLNTRKETESELTDNLEQELFKEAKNSILSCIQSISMMEEKLKKWQQTQKN